MESKTNRNYSKEALERQIYLLKTRISQTEIPEQKERLKDALRQKKAELENALPEEKNIEVDLFGGEISDMEEEKQDNIDGFLLYKYQRYKALLLENKNFSPLLIKDSYKLKNFKRGIRYIDLQKKDYELYKNWGESKKKPKSKIQGKSLSMYQTQLGLYYREFKKKTNTQIQDEWNELSNDKREEYDKMAADIIEKNKKRQKKEEKILDQFLENGTKLLNEKQELMKQIKSLRKDVIELSKEQKSNKELVKKRKELKNLRKQAASLNEELDEYKNIFLKKYKLDTLKKFSEEDQKRIKKRIQEMTKSIENAIIEVKDNEKVDEIKSQYENAQKLIQETISEQQKYMTEKKIELADVLNRINKKDEEIFQLKNEYSDSSVSSENKKSKSAFQIAKTQYKKLQREKESLQKNIDNNLEDIEKKTGLTAEKQKFEKQLEEYNETYKKSEQTINTFNQNIMKIVEMKKQIKRLDNLISLDKKEDDKNYELYTNEQQILQKQIETLQSENRKLKGSKEYENYWFQTYSETFKWIQKIKMLFNVYNNKLNVFRSFSTVKPKYIEFKQADLNLTRPKIIRSKTFCLNSAQELYTSLYNSKKPFLQKITAYLPDEYTSTPQECMKQLIKIGSDVLLNNSNIPIKIAHSNCTFLYINKKKKKKVNGITYYEILDKNPKFISEEGLLSQCNTKCPCEKSMPPSSNEYKCEDNKCVYRNKNNIDSYISIIKSYRNGILNELSELFKKKLKLSYPNNIIYASNVEKYYYVNSINLLAYIFNVILIFTLLTIQIHPNCVNHIFVQLYDIFKTDDYKNLPLNFKDLTNFICNETHYETYNQKNLILTFFFTKFKRELNTQLNYVYILFNKTIRIKTGDYVQTPVLQDDYKMWQNILITPQYAPVDTKKFKPYKDFLNNIHTLIQSDIKALDKSLKSSSKLLQLKRKKNKNKFLKGFIAYSSSLSRTILVLINQNKFNPYFNNLLQLTIHNFNIYYQSIKSLKNNTTELFVKLQTSLHNTLTQSNDNKKEMISIKENFSNSQLLTQIKQDASSVVLSSVDLEKDVEQPILWSKPYCNSLCSELDNLIEKDTKKQIEQPSLPSQPKSSQSKPTSQPNSSIPISDPSLSEEAPLPAESSSQNSFQFKQTSKIGCFQCNKPIKNKRLTTVDLNTNVPVSFCSFVCFTEYSG